MTASKPCEGAKSSSVTRSKIAPSGAAGSIARTIVAARGERESEVSLATTHVEHAHRSTTEVKKREVDELHGGRIAERGARLLTSCEQLSTILKGGSDEPRHAPCRARSCTDSRGTRTDRRSTNPPAIAAQRSGSPRPASIAPGTSRTNALSIDLHDRDRDRVRRERDRHDLRRSASPARKSGSDVNAKPKTYASPTAIAIVARLPQPSAVPIAIPATSPITQPVRQCVVAETASEFRVCVSVSPVVVVHVRGRSWSAATRHHRTRTTLKPTLAVGIVRYKVTVTRSCIATLVAGLAVGGALAGSSPAPTQAAAPDLSACARARARRARTSPRAARPRSRSTSRPARSCSAETRAGARARLRREARRLVRRAPPPRPRLPLPDRGRRAEASSSVESGAAISSSSGTATRRSAPADLDALARDVAAWGIRRVHGRVVGDERHFDSRALGARLEAVVPRGRVGAALGARPSTTSTCSGANGSAAAAARAFALALERPRRRRRAERRARVALRRTCCRSPAISPSRSRRSCGTMNRESDNFVSEMLLKELGASVARRGSTPAGARGRPQRSFELPACRSRACGSPTARACRAPTGSRRKALVAILRAGASRSGDPRRVRHVARRRGRLGNAEEATRPPADPRTRDRQDRNDEHLLGARRIRAPPLRLRDHPERLAGRRTGRRGRRRIAS